MPWRMFFNLLESLVFSWEGEGVLETVGCEVPLTRNFSGRTCTLPTDPAIAESAQAAAPLGSSRGGSWQGPTECLSALLRDHGIVLNAVRLSADTSDGPVCVRRRVA
jgi:hypothetical protein